MIGRARDVLASSEFASAYPVAFDAWAAAERLLWAFRGVVAALPALLVGAVTVAGALGGVLAVAAVLRSIALGTIFVALLAVDPNVVPRSSNDEGPRTRSVLPTGGASSTVPQGAVASRVRASSRVARERWVRLA